MGRFSMQSNSPSHVSPLNATTEPNSKANPNPNAAVGIIREAKRERVEYAKRLLKNPHEDPPNPVELVTDRLEKQRMRNVAWQLWGRLDNVHNGGR